MTGLTLPGMIEEPGCSAGRLISASPARGPEVSRIRSLAILESLIATLLSAPEYTTNPCWSQVAASMSLAGTMGLPVSLARWCGAPLGVALGGVEAGADGGGAHVDRVEVLLRVAQELDLAVQRGGEGVELLAHRHGDRVLQLGAAHLDDLQVRVALGAEGGGELLAAPRSASRCAG